ncbi:hypothetical protein OC842_006394 [Tilletia horrida]|uniref:Uncharacterized protein n=1 Tax=Tilletia horrida TaxID=155126 RepID=A0AAN6G8A4_9BASI|nr:hypothetical protein OC842_006394 [Tilletia horrida]
MAMPDQNDLPLPCILQRDSESFQLAVFLVRQLANKKAVLKAAREGAAALKTDFEDPFEDLAPVVFDEKASKALDQLAFASIKINAVFHALVDTLARAEHELDDFASVYTLAIDALNDLDVHALRRIALSRPRLITTRPDQLPKNGHMDSDEWVDCLRVEFTDDDISFAVAKAKNVVLRIDEHTSTSTAASVHDAMGILDVLAEMTPSIVPAGAGRDKRKDGDRPRQVRQTSSAVGLRQRDEGTEAAVAGPPSAAMRAQRQRCVSETVALQKKTPVDHVEGAAGILQGGSSQIPNPDNARLLAPSSCEEIQVPTRPEILHYKKYAAETKDAQSDAAQRRDDVGRRVEPIVLAIERSAVHQKRAIKNAAKKEEENDTANISTHRSQKISTQLDRLAPPGHRTMGTVPGSKAAQPVQSKFKDVPQARTQAQQVSALLNKISQHTASKPGGTAPRRRADSISPEVVVAAASAAADPKRRSGDHAKWLNVFRANSSFASDNSMERSASAGSDSFKTAHTASPGAAQAAVFPPRSEKTARRRSGEHEEWLHQQQANSALRNSVGGVRPGDKGRIKQKEAVKKAPLPWPQRKKDEEVATSSASAGTTADASSQRRPLGSKNAAPQVIVSAPSSPTPPPLSRLSTPTAHRASPTKKDATFSKVQRILADDRPASALSVTGNRTSSHLHPGAGADRLENTPPVRSSHARMLTADHARRLLR